MTEKCVPPNVLLPALPEAQQAMSQIVALVREATGLPVEMAFDRQSFSGSRKSTQPGSGILSVRGRLSDEGVILLVVELVRAPENARVSVASFFKHLSQLGEKTRLVPPERVRDEGNSLWVELGVQASILSMTRSSAFLNELTQLNELSKSLQYQVSDAFIDFELMKLYKDYPDLEPVHQLRPDLAQMYAPILDWARETIDFLSGSPSVALAAPSTVLEDFALSALSSAGKELSKPIARVIAPVVGSKGLVDLVRRAPGFLVVPTVTISLGTNFYEMGNEIKAMLAALSNIGKPAIFTGTYDQLQSVFHGGQGGMSDPLSPVVRRVPEIPQDILVRFAIQSAARHIGGLSPIAEEELTNEVKNSLAGLPTGEQIRILPVVTNRVLNVWNQGKKALVPPAATYATHVSALSETLAGLNAKPRAQRSAGTQDRFVKTLTDSQLLTDLKDQLLGQDRALEQLVTRLRMEVLTRPLHQPIRYCAQGTPGTGKSESAQILAQELGVPHINIDAASIPDYYSAAAQLLGSGRGIVGSYQSGRLEQAAKHHTGALIEVSDLDHANERVRSGLADLFLQVLETGEAQSAAGAVFSCSNLIFAFTMNLPDGMDEAIRKGIGFNQDSSRDAITAKVATEIKKMLSSAFLSRIGTPILFEPLDGAASVAIMERAIKSAVIAASNRLHLNPIDVILEPGLCARVIESLRTNLESFGARALLEYGRSLAADAVLRLDRENSVGRTLVVSSNQNGELELVARASSPQI